MVLSVRTVVVSIVRFCSEACIRERGLRFTLRYDVLVSVLRKLNVVDV